MSRSLKSCVAPWIAGCSIMMQTAGCSPTESPRSVASGPASGAEATFAFPIPKSPDSAWAEVFVPADVRVVRAAVVFIDRELDRYAFDDRDWRAMCRRAGCALVRVGLHRDDGAAPEKQRVRNAALGGDSAVLTALSLGAEHTEHPELQHAKVVVFGFSAAGSFGPTFATLHPDRTIGVIRYHSHLRGLPVDTSALAMVPQLIITGALDQNAGSEDARALWRVLRARGAPAAYVNHIGQPHYSIDGLVDAGLVLREWTETLMLQGASETSLPRLMSKGWLVDDSTGEVRAANGELKTPTTSWVPNARTAFGLRQLKGMCAQVPLRAAVDLLGTGAKLEAEDTFVCHYGRDKPRRDLWLSAESYDSDSAAVARLRRFQRAVPLESLGDAANLTLDTKGKCSTIGVARSAWGFFVSGCGDGFGVPEDSARLAPLARRVIGEWR